MFAFLRRSSPPVNQPKNNNRKTLTNAEAKLQRSLTSIANAHTKNPVNQNAVKIASANLQNSLSTIANEHVKIYARNLAAKAAGQSKGTWNAAKESQLKASEKNAEAAAKAAGPNAVTTPNTATAVNKIIEDITSGALNNKKIMNGPIYNRGSNNNRNRIKRAAEQRLLTRIANGQFNSTNVAKNIRLSEPLFNNAAMKRILKAQTNRRGGGVDGFTPSSGGANAAKKMAVDALIQRIQAKEFNAMLNKAFNNSAYKNATIGNKTLTQAAVRARKINLGIQ
jgi:hypothetical protein